MTSILPTFLLLIIISVSFSFSYSKSTPIVLWHGVNDCGLGPSCSGTTFSQLLQKAFSPNSLYVLSLSIGGCRRQDIWNSFFMPLTSQIQIACNAIARDTQLENGYNAIGFSQGSQFLRAVAQKCSQGMKNLISIGGQHQGIYGLPKCKGLSGFCDIMRRLLSYGAYTPWIQRLSVQAQYWHDPLQESQYRNSSLFLAKLNHESSFKNPYNISLDHLNHFVMVKFKNDSMVTPSESSWFGFYESGSGSNILPLRNSSLYLENRFGLRSLDESSRLIFLESEGDHLEMSTDWFLKEIVEPYLKN